LIALGLIPISNATENEERSIEDVLEHIYGESFGLEIISTSLLPHGSGLGTSSILAGCVMSSLGQSLGFDKAKDPSFLVRAVLNLEQLLRCV
jgi:fucokinase